MTLRQAIRAYCTDCIGGKGYLEIEACTGKMIDDTICTLHPYRFRNKGTKWARLKLIKKYCIHCLGGTRGDVLDTCNSQNCALFDYRYGKRPKLE